MLIGGTLAQRDARAADADFADKMDRFIAEILDFEVGPSVAVAIVQGDRVVYQNAHGYADLDSNRLATPETVYYIASSTKSFTALAAAMLDQRGELDLDAPLSQLLPDAEFHPQIEPEQITLQSLLTHTHGINNSGPVTFRCAYSGQHTADLLHRLLAYHGPATNGTKFEYGNIGYNIASLAMDAQLNDNWKKVLDREIFKPLGMQNTTGYVSSIAKDNLAQPCRAEPKGWSQLHYGKSDDNMHAAGGLVTTAADLTRWLLANVNGGRVDGRQVLPRKAFEFVHQPRAEQDSSFGPFKRTGYGLGWVMGRYDDDVFIHHFGGFSGFHSHIGFLPEHGLGVAVLSNSAGMGAIAAGATAIYAYDLLLDKPDIEQRRETVLKQTRLRAARARLSIGADRARRAARPQELARPLEQYTGTFESPLMGRATLAVVDGELEATMGPLWSKVEVFDNKRDALRVELTGSGSVVVVQFDDGEQATGIEVNGQLFQRVSEE